MSHTGTCAGHHRGIVPGPTPPPACEARALEYSLSLLNMLSGHSAGSQRGAVSCQVSHWPGTPCYHQQNGRPSTLSAHSLRAEPSLKSARGPPILPTAAASHCSSGERNVQIGRWSAVQRTQPPISTRSLSRHQVQFNNVLEIVSPDGNSVFTNTMLKHTSGLSERTTPTQTSTRSGSLTALRN